MVTNTAGSQHRDVMLVVQGESLGPEVVGSGWGPGQDGGTDLEHLCLKKLHKLHIHCRKIRDWTSEKTNTPVIPVAEKNQNNFAFWFVSFMHYTRELAHTHMHTP